MKNYGYILILLCLNSSIYVSSAQSSQPLVSQYSFGWAVDKTNMNNEQALPLSTQDLRFAQIQTLREIVYAVARNNNATELTLRSDKHPRLKELRVQREDAQLRIRTLTTFTAKSFQDDEFFENASIWDIASRAPHRDIGVTPRTHADFQQDFVHTNVDPNSEFYRRLSAIIFCSASGRSRIVFLPSYRIPSLVEQARLDNSLLSRQYQDLDPRRKEEIERLLQGGQLSQRPKSVNLIEQAPSKRPSSSCCQ